MSESEAPEERPETAAPDPAGSALPTGGGAPELRTAETAPRDSAEATAAEPGPAVQEPAEPAAERPAAGAEGAGDAEASGKYVYCIVPSSEEISFGAIGIGAEPADVHTIPHGDIAAVASDTPLEVYDPTRENVLAHERVNEEVMRRFTVIPMSFGTVFKTRQDIVELLRSAYDAFSDVLGKMKGKVEFGLKVLWEPERMIQEIEKDDENLRRLRQEISSQSGSTYFARMQYGRLVDSLLQERSEALAGEILAELREVSVASRVSKPIGDKMILNAAFLVQRDAETAFDARVKEIGARHEELTFKYTGPWPPYNFVNIRLKLERASESE